MEYKNGGSERAEEDLRRKVFKSNAWDANSNQANTCQPLHNTALKDKPTKGTSTQPWQLAKGSYGRTLVYK